MNEESHEHDSFEEERKGPIKIIIAVGLILLMVAVVIPYWGVKHNPEPKIIIDYALEQDNSQGRFENLNDINDYPVSVDIKRAANKIASEGCESGVKICQIKAIVYFVRDRIDYISDPATREFFQTPEATLFSGSGDCEDKSFLVIELLKAIGIQAELVTKPGHAFNRIYYADAPKEYVSNDGWIYVDTTCSTCGLGELEKII